MKTPSQVVCIESSFTIVPSFWKRMGLTLKWMGHLLRQLNFKETWLFSCVNLYKPSYRFIKSVKASCTFTLLQNPQIQKQIFRVTVVYMRHYPCLLVCLSIVFESVCVRSGVNIIGFVLRLCSLQFCFPSVSHSVCVSCQLIILLGSETWTDMNKKWMTDLLGITMVTCLTPSVQLQVENDLPLCP